MNIIFFKLAFRNILKNRISSIINVIGFSIGMAACLFIFLFVKYETGFDNFYPNSNNLYRVVGAFNSGNNVSKTGFVWFPMAEDIKNEIPGVDDFCRITREKPAKVLIDNQVHKIDNLRFADANFIDFFNSKLLLGNAETVLNSAHKIVLTEDNAKQLFGEENPIGKSLIYNEKLFTVSGITANPPLNSHIVYDAIASIKYIEQDDTTWKEYGGGITLLSYLQLSDNVNPEQIEKALPDFLNEKINKQWKGTGMSITASLQNIKDVHLSDGSIDYDSSTNRNKKSVYIIVLISVLILLLAIVNYVIIHIAKEITKTKEIAILKFLGAGKFSLIKQTYLEVVVIATIASVLGFLLLWVCTPFLNTHLKTSILVGNDIFSVVLFLFSSIFLLSVVVTLFSTKQGVFSKFVASKNLKNNFLVTFQFTIVIVLLISVFTVSRQNNFLLNTELGFDKENIITLQVDNENQNNKLLQFKQDLSQLAEIHSVSLSSQMIGNGITKNGYNIGNENESTLLNVLYTDANFLECFKVNLLLGRNFKANTKLDKDVVLINQQLEKRSGWKNPLNKKIHRNGDLKVIGVVEDFNFASLENAVQPMLIMSNPDWDSWGYSVVNIRFKTTDIKVLLSQISELWKAKFPETPFEVSFLDDSLASNYELFISQQKIISFFSFIAIFIASIGLLGLTIFTARTRIKEIGIRKVNGATIKDILILLNKNFVKWVIVAFIIACPIAYYVMSKWLENFAYKTNFTWWIFVIPGVLAVLISIVTVSWQSWSAATRNPIKSLKTE